MSYQAFKATGVDSIEVEEVRPAAEATELATEAKEMGPRLDSVVVGAGAVAEAVEEGFSSVGAEAVFVS